MVYKLDYIYKIHCGTHVTDGVTDNIVWNKVQGCPGSIPSRVLKIGKKGCIIYMFYISYM